VAKGKVENKLAARMAKKPSRRFKERLLEKADGAVIEIVDVTEL
jgi:hypothetical protein